MRYHFINSDKELGMKRHLYSVPLDGNPVEHIAYNPIMISMMVMAVEGAVICYSELKI